MEARRWQSLAVAAAAAEAAEEDAVCGGAAPRVALRVWASPLAPQAPSGFQDLPCLVWRPRRLRWSPLPRPLSGGSAEVESKGEVDNFSFIVLLASLSPLGIGGLGSRDSGFILEMELIYVGYSLLSLCHFLCSIASIFQPRVYCSGIVPLSYLMPALWNCLAES
jgi:hypothetical protein